MNTMVQVSGRLALFCPAAIIRNLVPAVLPDLHSPDGFFTVVKWGDNNLLDSAEACCDQCSSTKGCNVWVWCAEPGGCGGGDKPRPHKECWLKNADIQELLENVVGRGHSGA